ncbi:hypothetical protein [Vibrio vulnificus]|uniref:hypothetical protein n=1 Tax=Vibrio vulnificus TaxID=672 RepID=UPI001EEF3DE0|nr:hypothetical protein [Vibrio vulnificus]
MLTQGDTAEWVSRMTGTILVDDETRYIEANKSLSEVMEDKRNIRMAERQYVDTNMLLNLPAFVSYIFTTNDVPKPSLISPIKVRKQQLVTFDEVQNNTLSDVKEIDEKNAVSTSGENQEAEKDNNINVETESVLETETLEHNDGFVLDAFTPQPDENSTETEPTEPVQSQEEIDEKVEMLKQQVKGVCQ